MRITDRSKDVIKSGGEWISSIDLENLAVGHPAVAEAAVIGIHHPKWDERPLLIVQLKQGQNATREDILKFMDGKIAKWWMPDDVAFVDGIPHTATGKILKTALRDQFKATVSRTRRREERHGRLDRPSTPSHERMSWQDRVMPALWRCRDAASPNPSLEFAAGPWSQTGQFAAWRHSPGNGPTRQILIDGPQVFRSLSVGARVQPRHMGAQSRGVFGGRGAGVDHHRPLRLPRNATGAGDVLRRAGLRRLSILVGLAAFVAIWQNGSRGMGRILLALLIDAVVLAYPAYLGLQYRKLPPIHDITTDPVDPPRFDALARLRTGDGTNTAVYAGLYSAEQQRLAYPDVETVELEVPVQRAFEVTMQLVNKRKWLVIDERPPQPPRRIGRIEAVARTPIMGFREDVSIRVTPDGEGSRVDIRSSSRYFESDLGSNAARITRLIDDINNAVDNAKPAVKKPQAPAKAPPKMVKK